MHNRLALLPRVNSFICIFLGFNKVWKKYWTQAAHKMLFSSLKHLPKDMAFHVTETSSEKLRK